MSLGGWLLQLGIAVDQVLNVLITPFHGGAWADETLSARAYRMDQDGKPWGRILRPLIDMLFFWQDQHCRTAYRYDIQRRMIPPEDRG